VCATLGLIATSVQGQQTTADTLPLGQPQSSFGVTRTILKRTDYDGNRVAIVVLAEIEPGTTVPRHTHPGIENAYVIEGGFEQFAVQGQPEIGVPKAGDAFQVPAAVPHEAKTGSRPTRLVSTYVVEKGKPLASPA
jgi:quercetin dioxygenase-like cupin family protein